MLANPAKSTMSNLAGITHVTLRMSWYCALTEHLLSKNNIESFEAVREQLEKAVIALYKALLLYQMKSVCSYYRNQGLVFLRGLVSLDNWDGDLQRVTSPRLPSRTCRPSTIGSMTGAPCASSSTAASL
jgi:hypothetical protein